MNASLRTVILVCAAISALPAISAAQGCDEPDSVKSVTRSRVGNFDHVTFSMVSEKPEYTVKTSYPPYTKDESDERLHVRGKHFKSVQFRGVHWMCTISEHKKGSTSNVMDVKNAYQFEGDLVYVIGYRTRSKYAGHYVTGTGQDKKVVVRFRR